MTRPVVRRLVVAGRRIRRWRRYFPGMVVALTVAAAARFLSDHYGAPQMLFALLLGLAFHFLAEDRRSVPGIQFTASRVLRVGVALLGLRITVEQVAGLGWGLIGWVGAGVVMTIAVGWAASKLLGRGGSFGVLTGGAVGICGASAAMAISAVLPRHPHHERDTIFAVIAVTTLSTIAMVVYPIVARALGLDDHSAGIFLGGTIHDVAQVVGAGYGISPEAGDVATVTKLFRVAMLVPVVFALSLVFGRREGGAGRRPPLPLFVVAFCLLVAANSLGLVPEAARQPLSELSSWCLVAAIAALGVKTSLKALVTVGAVPVSLMVAETLFIATWVLAGAAFLG
ncbi:YeiH family protein [Shumkonia mesophila]|uniref:YeiH family protein n=1 Tax=Shumkonia mesophila TaxID=2838854 RepID=UPI002934CE49|nr:putative sulfate exporter family transporter [Shumkonia mesophila]